MRGAGPDRCRRAWWEACQPRRGSQQAVAEPSRGGAPSTRYRAPLSERRRSDMSRLALDFRRLLQKKAGDMGREISPVLSTTFSREYSGPLVLGCHLRQSRRRVPPNPEEPLQALATDNSGRSSPRRFQRKLHVPAERAQRDWQHQWRERMKSLNLRGPTPEDA